MNTHNEDDHPHEVQPPEMVPSSREEQPLEPEPTAEEGHSETSLPAWFKRNRLFAAGFLGWFLVNGLLWSIAFASRFDILVFLLNLIIMLLLLAIKRVRPIGLGILAAIGVNLIISLALGLSFNAVCFIPFFFPE